MVNDDRRRGQAQRNGRFRGSGHSVTEDRDARYRVLCRFFLFFFLRLCVAIFLSFLFLPQGTFALLRVAIERASGVAAGGRDSL